MPAMTKTALSDCSYPESTVCSIQDDIDTTTTRLKVVIDEEASLRKALRALFIKRREKALEQVRLANLHLALVNEEEAQFCDDLMKAVATANEGPEGSGCAGSVRTGDMAMPTIFPIRTASPGNDPSLNGVEDNRRKTPVSPKMLNHGDCYNDTAPPRTPPGPTRSFDMEPLKSPTNSTRGIVDEPPRSPARSTRAFDHPQSPVRSTHGFAGEPTRTSARSTRVLAEDSIRSPARSARGVVEEPPRSPARSAYGFEPPRSPSRLLHALSRTSSPVRYVRGMDPSPSFAVLAHSTPRLSGQWVEQEDIRSERTYHPYQYPWPNSCVSDDQHDLTTMCQHTDCRPSIDGRSHLANKASLGAIHEVRSYWEDNYDRSHGASSTSDKRRYRNDALSHYTESRCEDSRYYGRELENEGTRSERTGRTYDPDRYPRADSRGSENHQEDRDDLISITRLEYTEGDRYDDPGFNDQRRGTRDDRSRRHDYPTSVSSRTKSSRCGPMDDQRSYGRGLRVGVDTPSMYSRQTDQRPLPPAAVFDDRSTRDDPVLSSRFSISTTAASVQPHLKSQRKRSPTEPVPELKPRQLTDAEMYKLSKVGDFFNFMSPTKKPEQQAVGQTSPSHNPFRF